MTTMTTADSAEMLRAVGRKWWLVAVFGVITLGFGVVLTIRPSKSVHTIAIIFAIWLLVLGVVRLLQAIGSAGQRFGLIVVGLLSILVAILLLHHTSTSLAFVGFVIGIFWTIGGIAQFFEGFSANDGKVSWPIVFLGVVSTAIGVLCLVYPKLSLSIISVIIGLGLIVYGLVEILASVELRKLKSA